MGISEYNSNSNGTHLSSVKTTYRLYILESQYAYKINQNNSYV